eukprot:TRINITY_DN16559_c0_g1_i1.p1 TRINITY_DN16559_c0_g1~~TRINITY_DN16559_c0_g1_i1.p1  ORF type:complete len:1557 (+),score=196.35 TRINITY_DN16559_c0_g1_i1:34-4671(+)
MATRSERQRLIRGVCNELQASLGFQSDSVRNQAEHVEALWESFLTRGAVQTPPCDNPSLALDELASQLLRTQRRWCMLVWQPFVFGLRDTRASENTLRDVCLYLLIWGELGNLRFCPELACFLFEAARAFHGVNLGAGYTPRASSEDAFLNKIMKPLFNAVLCETYDSGDPPKFKFGKSPAPAKACNYDDWNELFWDDRRLSHALKLRSTTRKSWRLRPSCHSVADVWAQLPHVDWSASLRKQKSHRELHSIIPLLVGSYRIFLAHTILFTTLLLYWTSEIPWGSWTQRASLGLVAPLWMLLYFIGFQMLTPTIPLCSRLASFLNLLFVQLSPCLTFAIIFLEEGEYVRVAKSVQHILDEKYVHVGILVLHFTLSIFVFLQAMEPRALNSCQWRFFPSVSSEDGSRGMIIFWSLVALGKGLFDMLVMPYCGEAIDGVLALIRGNESRGPGLLIAFLTILITSAALCSFASMPFFINFAIAIAGWVKGIINLGGCKLFWYRRGVLTHTPERMCNRVLQVPHDTGGGVGWLHWWNRMSEQEISAFVEVWNGMLEELHGKDLLSRRELKELAFETGDVAHIRAGPPNIPRLLNPLDIFGALPSNREAKRRIVALARSLQMRMPAGTVREMPALSVLIPHYEETILFSRHDLFKEGRCADLLRFLLQYYRDEFEHFAERLQTQTEGRSFSVTAAASASSFGLENLEDALCKWASLRMQTLWRTVEGISNTYSKALTCLTKYQESLSDEDQNSLLQGKFQVVVAMQRYAKFGKCATEQDAIQLAAAEQMLEKFGKWLCIAYIDEDVGDSENEKRYYSCLIDSSCALLPNGMRQPKYRIELPGFPILGHGKSDNQNCAVVFTRGEVLQMIDCNQDAYFEASLFLPLALQEFGAQRNGRRPGILGFREHIFSDMGLPGKLAADSEFAFGTVIQRTLDRPLGARLHYGHPDMLDKLQMLQQGGVSKGTKGLNLSEDVFAGIDLVLRGGWTLYREYFHVGKGRDMGFMSVMSFNSKVSMGNGEQAITRQWMRLGLGLPLQRYAGMYYTHVGHYLNQCLLSWATKGFAFTAAFFTLARLVDGGFPGPAVNLISHYFGPMYLLFVLATMLPLLFEINLENGCRKCLRSIGRSLLALSPVFSAFQSKLMGHAFWSTVNYGGAQYIPTGRGLSTTRDPFVKLFRAFAGSNIYDGFEAALYLAVSYGVFYGTVFYACVGLAVYSWVYAPFLYNPQQFISVSTALNDSLQWLKWLCHSAEGNETLWSRDRSIEDKSWAVWAMRMQECRRSASMLWIVFPSRRLIAALCTLALLWELHVDKYALLPLLAFVVPCFAYVLLRRMILVVALCFRTYADAARLELQAASPVRSYVAPAVLALSVCVAELWITVSADTLELRLCIVFHKYLCMRFMLEAADGIAAHRFGGCLLSVVHDACRLWTLAHRFLRDFLLCAMLTSVGLVLSSIPGLARLHAFFLFHTTPREQMAQEGAPDSLLRNFFTEFAPDVLLPPGQSWTSETTGNTSLSFVVPQFRDTDIERSESKSFVQPREAREGSRQVAFSW